LALLSDALHNFSDVLTLIFSWYANKLSQEEASLHQTFGQRGRINNTINASTFNHCSYFFFGFMNNRTILIHIKIESSWLSNLVSTFGCV
jgi:divalent metal cation (Fe/Co/Zn/Cd) transporter